MLFLMLATKETTDFDTFHHELYIPPQLVIKTVNNTKLNIIKQVFTESALMGKQESLCVGRLLLQGMGVEHTGHTEWVANTVTQARLDSVRSSWPL